MQGCVEPRETGFEVKMLLRCSTGLCGRGEEEQARRKLAALLSTSGVKLFCPRCRRMVRGIKVSEG